MGATDGIELQIERIDVHEKNDPDTVSFDVAILKIKNRIRFSDLVKPVSLARQKPKSGSVCTVSGFGTTSESGEETQSLRIAKVKIIDQTDCGSTYSKEGDT